LRAHSISASVQGRPKHIYSIVKKMRGKSLSFDQLFDIRAMRVIVPTVKDCYAALSWVHEQFTPLEKEFDDYIAKPKPNGYQSLHTVVRDETGRTIEIQIRTQAMHDHAEHGVAAHWAYKEAGTKGYAGVSASSEYDAKIAVLRQLLAWGSDLTGSAQRGLFEDRIYVLTPDAAVIELPQGATPVDFAYSVHTSLGHRCRGARGRSHGAAEHRSGKRPDGGDQHGQGRPALARLAQCRAGLSGQQPCQGQGARLVQCPGHARNRLARARGR
jgi:GTP pyrophosphokinase